MSETPPQFTGYPRYAPRPRIRFETIGEAWRLIMANLGTWILASTIMFGLSILVLIPFYVLMFSSVVGQREPNLGLMLVAYGWMFVAMFLMMGVQAVSQGGMYRLALKQIRGEETTIADFFSIRDCFWQLVATGFLVGLAIWIGTIACYLPGFIVGGLLMFAYPLLVDQKEGIIPALTTSWNMLRNDLWMATGFWFVASLASGLGAFVCGIGMLVTLPLLPISVALVYRDFQSTPYDPETPVAPYNVMDR